jgi:hypothetical protein
MFHTEAFFLSTLGGAHFLKYIVLNCITSEIIIPALKKKKKTMKIILIIILIHFMMYSLLFKFYFSMEFFKTMYITYTLHVLIPNRPKSGHSVNMH